MLTHADIQKAFDKLSKCKMPPIYDKKGRPCYVVRAADPEQAAIAQLIIDSYDSSENSAT